MPTYKDEERKTWYCQFYYTDFTGARKKKKKRGFTTQREAKEYEKQFTLKAQRDTNMTFGSLWELYWRDVESRIRSSTKNTKQNNVETHILPYFKDRTVASITVADIREWQNAMLKKRNEKTGAPYAPTYLRSINSQLSAIFNYAVRFQSLGANPCHQVAAIGKKRAPKMQFWTLDEFNRFIAHEAAPGYHLAFMLLYWCGMRSGELLALSTNKKLPDNALDIYETFKREKGEDVYTDPKSDNGIRQVLIPEFLAEEWRDYTQALYGLTETDRIFHFQRTALNKELKRVADLAKVKSIRVHDLRHSHVALLIELGYNSHEIAARIGDTPEEVDKTYAHLYPEAGRRIVQELERHRDGFAEKIAAAEKIEPQ